MVTGRSPPNVVFTHDPGEPGISQARESGPFVGSFSGAVGSINSSVFAADFVVAGDVASGVVLERAVVALVEVERTVLGGATVERVVSGRVVLGPPTVDGVVEGAEIALSVPFEQPEASVRAARRSKPRVNLRIA